MIAPRYSTFCREFTILATVLIAGTASALIISKPFALSHNYNQHERVSSLSRGSRVTTRQSLSKALHWEAENSLPCGHAGGLLGAEQYISRADMIVGFCAAALTATAGICRASAESSEGLGVVDDLLANCPSVRPKCLGDCHLFIRHIIDDRDIRTYPYSSNRFHVHIRSWKPVFFYSCSSCMYLCMYVCMYMYCHHI